MKSFRILTFLLLVFWQISAKHSSFDTLLKQYSSFKEKQLNRKAKKLLSPTSLKLVQDKNKISRNLEITPESDKSEHVENLETEEQHLQNLDDESKVQDLESDKENEGLSENVEHIIADSETQDESVSLDTLPLVLHNKTKEIEMKFLDIDDLVWELTSENYKDDSDVKKQVKTDIENLFLDIRKSVLEESKILKNYIDSQVITEKIAIQFMKYMTKHGKEGVTEDNDVSLTQVLLFFNSNSHLRSVHQNEAKVFDEAEKLNDFLMKKHFSIVNEKEVDEIYSENGKESLKAAMLNAVGLSNFVASFGRILMKNTIKGKSEKDIKRVMDTDPEDESVDFELYTMPLSKKQQEDEAIALNKDHGDVVKDGLIVNKRSILHDHIQIMNEELAHIHENGVDHDHDHLLKTNSPSKVNSNVSVTITTHGSKTNLKNGNELQPEIEENISEVKKETLDESGKNEIENSTHIENEEVLDEKQNLNGNSRDQDDELLDEIDGSEEERKLKKNVISPKMISKIVIDAPKNKSEDLVKKSEDLEMSQDLITTDHHENLESTELSEKVDLDNVKDDPNLHKMNATDLQNQGIKVSQEEVDKLKHVSDMYQIQHSHVIDQVRGVENSSDEIGETSLSEEDREMERLKKLEKKGYPHVEEIDIKRPSPLNSFQIPRISLTKSIKKFDENPEYHEVYNNLNQIISLPFQEMKTQIQENPSFNRQHTLDNSQYNSEDFQKEEEEGIAENLFENEGERMLLQVNPKEQHQRLYNKSHGLFRNKLPKREKNKYRGEPLERRLLGIDEIESSQRHKKRFSDIKKKTEEMYQNMLNMKF